MTFTPSPCSDVLIGWNKYRSSRKQSYWLDEVEVVEVDVDEVEEVDEDVVLLVVVVDVEVEVDVMVEFEVEDMPVRVRSQEYSKHHSHRGSVSQLRSLDGLC